MCTEMRIISQVCQKLLATWLHSTYGLPGTWSSLQVARILQSWQRRFQDIPNTKCDVDNQAIHEGKPKSVDLFWELRALLSTFCPFLVEAGQGIRRSCREWIAVLILAWNSACSLFWCIILARTFRYCFRRGLSTDYWAWHVLHSWSCWLCHVPVPQTHYVESDRQDSNQCMYSHGNTWQMAAPCSTNLCTIANICWPFEYPQYRSGSLCQSCLEAMTSACFKPSGSKWSILRGFPLQLISVLYENAGVCACGDQYKP